MTVPIMSLVGKTDSADVTMSPVVDSMGELVVGPSDDLEAERTLVIESTALFEGMPLRLYLASL